MRALILCVCLTGLFVACERPSLPGTGSGGAIGDALKDNQAGHGESKRGEPESTPLPKKEK
jgi:hypothetical protein